MVREKKIKVEKVVKDKKIKKEKLPTKICFFCGENTNDYEIYRNGAVCNDCVKKDEFKKFKENHENQLKQEVNNGAKKT